MAKEHPPCARALHEDMKGEISLVWSNNLEVYGADKVWGSAQPGGHQGGPLHRRAIDA